MRYGMIFGLAMLAMAWPVATPAAAQRVYDASGRPMGRFDGTRIYDSSGRSIGRVDGDRFYDASGRSLGRMDDDCIYDASGQSLGRGDGLTREQTILYFYFFLNGGR